MIRAALLVFTVALTGCSKDEPLLTPLADFCERAVKSSIISPATYQRVEAQESFEGLRARVLFDAENGYGALLRSEALCRFDEDLGVDSVTIDGKQMAVPAYIK